MQRVEQGPGRKLRRLRELLLHILGADRLDIGDAAAAEYGERFRRDLAEGDVVSVLGVHGPRLLSTPLQVESWLMSSVAIEDADRLHDPLRLRPGQIDRQQPALEVGPQHLHSVREHEGALELARRDAAVEIVPGLVILLPPADDQLVFLQRHVELIAREAGDRQRDAQALRLSVLASDPLDVVGWISVRTLGDAVERTLDLVKPEQ